MFKAYAVGFTDTEGWEGLLEGLLWATLALAEAVRDRTEQERGQE